MAPLRSAVPVALLLFLVLPSVVAAQPTAPSKKPSASPGCGPKDMAFWNALKAREGMPEAGQSVEFLAPVLVSCLGSPVPELRDGVAFELLTLWMRSGTLSDDALRPLTETLIGQLGEGLGQTGKDTVFRRTFSALVLSEVIRRDNLKPFLSPEAFAQVLTSAVHYLEAERDLRGFSDTRGWMHGVAHAADLLWRLAMSSRLEQPGLEQILQAVATKLAPPEHAYIHNESDRLARVVLVVIRRGLVPPAVLARWLEGVTTPQGLKSWDEAFRSEAGLARLHNTKQFLRALHSMLVLQKTAPPNHEQVIPLVVSALDRVNQV